MSRYTVIGASGFVGSRVLAELRTAGCEPWCPARGDSELLKRDLGRIIYCAGLTGDFRTKPFNTVEAHVSLLAGLIQKASFERIVYLSSTRLYDLLTDGVGVEDRSIPVDPTDSEHLYELSKMMGENLTLQHTGGRGMAARLSYVFGWGDGAQGFLSDWLRRARGSRSITLDSSPTFARDYIHVDDVARALVAMADSSESGIINVASGETLSNQEIADVFTDKGWNVRFSRDSKGCRPSLLISSARLNSLGIRPRPVLPSIRQYLSGLSARPLA